MVFDTWGGILTPKAYRDFSLRYMIEIVAALKKSHPDTPVTLFTKNGGMWLPQIARTGCDGVGCDWTIDLRDARALTDDKVTLQGNLDPGVLYGSRAKIKAEVIRVLESYGEGERHIFNLGHGIHQHIDPDNVEFMIETLHELSPSFHSHSSTL